MSDSFLDESSLSEDAHEILHHLPKWKRRSITLDLYRKYPSSSSRSIICTGAYFCRAQEKHTAALVKVSVDPIIPTQSSVRGMIATELTIFIYPSSGISKSGYLSKQAVYAPHAIVDVDRSIPSTYHTPSAHKHCSMSGF